MAEVNIDVAKESTGQQILSAGAKETTSQEILSKLDSGGGVEKRYYYSEDVFPTVLIDSEISEAGAPGTRWNYYLGEFIPEHSGMVNIEISTYVVQGNGYSTTSNFNIVSLNEEKNGSPVAANNNIFFFVAKDELVVGTLYGSVSANLSSSPYATYSPSITNSTTYITTNVMCGVTKGVPIRLFRTFDNSSQYIRCYVNSLKIGYVVK